jgi:DNA-binding MarR family transcriptional regulator
VGRLEERGIVTRSALADDGRAAVVGLTEAGCGLLDRAAEVHARVVHEELTSRFSKEEHAVLLRTLGEIDG